VFTICASVEIAARLRGGRGAFGWIRALPWDNPIKPAVAFSFVLLGFGGAGGLINMSYQLDTTIHNTQRITGHFHLIFDGAIVIMYFAIAYDLWPHLAGRALPDLRLVRAQLWLWFVGMIVTTFPWHWVGILGMPRRMAYYDYSDPAIAPQAFSVALSAIGAFVLLISGFLLLFILATAHRQSASQAGIYRFSVPVHPVRSVPLALNSFAIWVALMIGLTVTNYGCPIFALATRSDTSVPAVYVGAQ
jgi:cytochrome c oxidase subunit 1